jgi:hypothetical protein
MNAADAGVIAAIVLGLLCLRRRRCPDSGTDETCDERRAEDQAVCDLETWREGL